MELLVFIKELLTLNDCVIIPGFGGFVSSYQPAAQQASRFTPPSKTVSFNKKLNFNDGLFINYIAEKEGISYFLASRKVNLLVEEMNYRLTDGEEICIPEIGNLRYDDHENLIFIPQISSNLNADAFGLTTFTFETLLARKKSSRQISAPVVPQAQRDAVQVIFRKRTLQKVMIAVPLLVALAVTPIKNYTNYLQESNLSGISGMITVTKPVTPAEISVAEEIEESKPEEAPVPDHNYFIIGGSFKSDENAANYFATMKEKGYPVTDLGIIKGLHYIAVQSFATLDEAQQAHREFTSSMPDSGAWIYIKK